MFISNKGVESLSIMKNKLLTKKLNTYLEYVKDFVAHQRDGVNDIHTLRVNSRELSSLISTDDFFYTQLKKLIKASNALRDMDVFVDIYLKSLPKRIRIKLDIKSIKKSVRKRRRKRTDKLHAYLKSLAIPNNVIFNEIEKNRSLDMSKDLPSLEQTELHKYRITIKKQLYNEKNHMPPDEHKIKILTKIKDLLGSINDNYNGLKQLGRYHIRPKLYNKIKDFTEDENLRLYIEFKEITVPLHAK
jgi:CHAD domain-containing protein